MAGMQELQPGVIVNSISLKRNRLIGGATIKTIRRPTSGHSSHRFNRFGQNLLFIDKHKTAFFDGIFARDQ
jgi:hypothetical protein